MSLEGIVGYHYFCLGFLALDDLFQHEFLVIAIWHIYPRSDGANLGLELPES
jgi:hypothetical protein